MQLANPIYFLLLLFIILFVIFYFFRKQYTKQVIPSNLLWEEVLKEIKASSWFHRWHNNVLFWLQLICLLLLMLALVEPYMEKETIKGEQIILLFDTSASMATKGKETNRLEDRKERALHMLKNKQANQTVTIMEVSDKPEIILSKEKDVKKINKVIQNIKLSYTHENWQSAIELASSIAKEGKTAIHFFSDQVNRETLTNLQTFYVEVHNEPLEEENLSLLSFGVSHKQDKVIGIATVENQTNSEKKVPLLVESEGTELVKKELQLQPNEKKIVQIQDLPEKAYYGAKIMIKDDYEVDNLQTAILQKQMTTVYASQNINPFILKGYEAIGLQVVQMEKEEDFLQKEDGIFLLSGSTIPENIQQPFVFFYEGDKKNELTNGIESTENELLQRVDMKDVYIASSSTNTIKENMETILKSEDRSLVQKGDINHQPSVLIHFDMKDSDWPLHASFPIFLYNIYQWLTSQTSYLGDFNPLETRTVTINSSVDEWDIYKENNQLLKTISLEKDGFQAPSYPGVYQLTSDRDILYFSVNLDDREKSIASEKSFTMNEDQIEDIEVSKSQNDWIWYVLCALVLLILCIEWEVYRRADNV